MINSPFRGCGDDFRVLPHPISEPEELKEELKEERKKELRTNPRAELDRTV
jgi:hypothetical protein